MLLQALLGADPSARSQLERAALAAHATMLEHGFVCVGSAEPPAEEAVRPTTTTSADGEVSLCILPKGWNAAPDNFAFCYMHPLRGASETFSLKALSIAGTLAVHAASSLTTAELLTVTLKVDGAASADAEVQEKIAAGIAVKLLARHDSTARLGKALDASQAASTTPSERTGASKRPAPENEQPTRPGFPLHGDRPGPGLPTFPGVGGIDDARPPLLWTPDGGLLGPRHPAWGQVIPGRGGRVGGGGHGGFLPRFDPIGPGSGEPDPDHLRVPGMFPDNFPTFQGGASGRRGMDPDGMFIM
mmetsp:Transcript_123753/g.309341  ORF Transcript_123753/g.309341 Transcript_123753/m.309341 type:complete len:302 (+) Transcript_123753:85-990(+)